MKTIVVYKSKSGFVKQYAQWITEELSADIAEQGKVLISRLQEYDTVIYGGGLYIGGINGVKFIVDNLDKLAGKKLIVFATGASPARKEAIEEVLSHNFTEDQLKTVKFFYLRGGFNFSKLRLIDKVLMTLLRLKIERKKAKNVPLNYDEAGMLAAYGKPVDFVKRKNINDLIEYARNSL